MHERRTLRSSREAATGAKIRANGGVRMNRLIARLIDCGMTRDVALCVLRQIRNPKERELYVERIEEASHEQMEDV